MKFSKINEIKYDERTIEVGPYETARDNGDCLWIDDKLCIDLNTLKIIYREK